MYEYFAKLLEARGVTASDVSKATGIPKRAFSDWKNGRYKQPSPERLQLLANYFDVPVGYFITGDAEPVYYEDPETAAVAQKMKDDRDFRLLFSAAKDAAPETLQAVYDVLIALKKRERGGEE